MAFTDDAIDITVAIGRGIYSVGEDIVLGLERTGEGLGLGQDGRMASIGYENNAMIGLIENMIKLGVDDRRSPLYRSIAHVLEHYYSYFPDSAIEYLAKQAGIGAGYTAGRMLIGKKLAEAVAARIAVVVATSALFKQIATRIGLSAGTSATGIGAPIGLLMMQGLLQRSSHAAMRLAEKSPALYKTLERNGDLQLLYFLIEKPMSKYIDAIAAAERAPQLFNGAIERVYRGTAVQAR